MKDIQRKLDWRLNNILIAQQKASAKLKDVEMIIEMRKGNEKSLRAIGKKLKMSHQKVDNLLKQFGIL